MKKGRKLMRRKQERVTARDMKSSARAFTWAV